MEMSLGHGSGSFSRRLGNHLFERDIATREIAHGLHQVNRHAVALPLRDGSGRFPEVRGERGRTPFFCFEPGYEVHASSLDQPKPTGQGVSKPEVFSIRYMTNARRKRFLSYFNDGPLKGSREALIRRTGLTKGRISQLFDEGQPFGERAASSLAEKLGLPPDFFERDMGATPIQALHPAASADQALTLTADEHRLLKDMRDLLPEELERLQEEIHGKAEQMRRHAALVLERAGVTARAPDERVAHIKPAPEWKGEERRTHAEPVREERRSVYFRYEGGPAASSDKKKREA